MRKMFFLLLLTGLTPALAAGEPPEGSPPAAAAPPTDPKVIPNPNFPELHQLLMARDPFKRPDLGGGEIEIRAPLQSYPVDAFRMIGVLTGPLRKSAMLLAPDGKSYVVRQKSKIGLKDGVVLRVEDEKVVVREKVANIFGETEVVDEEIVLQKAKVFGSLGVKDQAEDTDLGRAARMDVPSATALPKPDASKKDNNAVLPDKARGNL